jgi:hypothetical protein
MLMSLLIIDQIALRQAIVVVQSVDFLDLRKAVLRVFEHIKRVHEDEIGRLALLEQFLFKSVAVLPVVDHNFAVCGRGEPLVVRLEETTVK